MCFEYVHHFLSCRLNGHASGPWCLLWWKGIYWIHVGSDGSQAGGSQNGGSWKTGAARARVWIQGSGTSLWYLSPRISALASVTTESSNNIVATPPSQLKVNYITLVPNPSPIAILYSPNLSHISKTRIYEAAVPSTNRYVHPSYDRKQI